MVVVFERKKEDGKLRFEVIRGSERDERLFIKLFAKYGHDIAKNVPVGYPINLDVYKLKKLLEGKKKKIA